MRDLNEQFPIYSPPLDIVEWFYYIIEAPETVVWVGFIIFVVFFIWILDFFINKKE